MMIKTTFIFTLFFFALHLTESIPVNATIFKSGELTEVCVSLSSLISIFVFAGEKRPNDRRISRLWFCIVFRQ